MRLYYLIKAWWICHKLERKGLLYSYRDEDGTRRWRRTILGDAVAGLISVPEDVR